MLDRFKIILTNVGMHEELFKKELIKSREWLQPFEWDELKRWVEINFEDFDEILNQL